MRSQIIEFRYTNIDVAFYFSSSFPRCRKELVWTACFIGVVAVLSAFVGASAGISISIHFMETAQTPSFSRIAARERSMGPYLRVTMVDPKMSFSNIASRKNPHSADGIGLERVVTKSPTGWHSVLMVVDEQSLNDTEINGRWNKKAAMKLSPYELDWKPQVRPKMCSDGRTAGFDSWSTLRDAVQEANTYSARRFLHWTEYFAWMDDDFDGVFEDDSLYFEPEIRLAICPKAKLTPPKKHYYYGPRNEPIYVNAENIVLECDDCTMDAAGGTGHFLFGPQAKNALIRGVTFRRAKGSSISFYGDGAEVSFEDCLWVGQKGAASDRASISDVNSVVTLNFLRCEMDGINLIPLSLS